MDRIYKVGDKVWVKNLVTNESIPTVIKSAQKLTFEDGSSCMLYGTDDGGMRVNVDGKPSSGNIFSSKEACDAFPRYIPKSGPVYVGNYTEEDWKRFNEERYGEI